MDRKTTLIAIGGGEMAETESALEVIVEFLKDKKAGRLVVMTVATNDEDGASAKYNRLFRGRGIKHVQIVNVSSREDAFNKSALRKIKEADAIFFTGGDQLNITSLIGGSPLHNLLHERFENGILIAGTSAGAAMMSTSMIIDGKSDTAPRVGGVEIAPGMNLIDSTIIDSHFSQRGRHGRLLTAVAHYPQVLGLGIDERTALVYRNGQFKVIGEGVVTVVDGSHMEHSDLPYRAEKQRIGMFGVDVHVLPSGYSYDVRKRKPIAPVLRGIERNGRGDGKLKTEKRNGSQPGADR
jgi:cyanophycinase